MKKKLLSALLSVAMVASLLVGCGGSAETEAPAAETKEEAPAAETKEEAPAEEVKEEAPAEEAASTDKFYIYSWNTELGDRLQYVYDANPGVQDRIEYVNVGDSSVYQEKIDQLLQTPDAEDYPDLIAFEAGYIMKYTNSDYTLPVTDLGITDADLAEMYPYTLTIATDKRDGSLKGLSWQSCPGSFMYRTDLAESLLGVTSPEEMQAKISTWDDFIATAKEIKEASGDATRILSSNGDVTNVFMSNKTDPCNTTKGGKRMLAIVREWDDFKDYKIKTVEYRKMDFFGPFLTLEIKQYKKGGTEVKPISCTLETADVSESDYALLCKAAKELYKRIGEFVLKTHLFDVTINSTATEKLLLEKLMNLKLF